MSDLAVEFFVQKSNPCHVPSGPAGGQFCETGSGRGGNASPDPASVVRFDAGGKRGVVLASELPFVSPYLTRDEQSAVSGYKSFGYKAINEYQATGKTKNENTKREAQAMASVMKRTSVAEPVSVYRGVNGPLAGKLSTLPEGAVFKAPCYQSTSTSLETASKFALGELGEAARVGSTAASPTILHFKVQPKMRAIPIAKLSGFADTEKELVLDRGTSWRVAGKKQNAAGVTVVTLEKV